MSTGSRVSAMSLALSPPLRPMEARSVDELPVGPDWQYEPKWDGFRCLIFRDGETIALQSKAGKPLTRYFPDVVAAVAALEPQRFVLDGEIVVPRGKAFSFDDLLQRIHPAKSRVDRLATETPAMVVVFDLLAGEDGRTLVDDPLSVRRATLEAFADNHLAGRGSFRLSPATDDVKTAQRWLKGSGAMLDGVIAKHRHMAYAGGERTAMVKIKNFRSADCVVGGFRYNEGKPVVGSLLLGLYDQEGLLDHVGFTSNIPRDDKPALTKKLEKLIAPPGFTGDAPGGPSRWSTERSTQWQPLKPKLVVEVAYDHYSGGRFRHGTSLMRFRPDKAPRQCTLEQVMQKVAKPMKLLG
ncbi:ATP-dependent DNA ligase [Xanthobacteraceae bacterium Astr-EGSB]|uniref:ATP-dependent DNA ligase n=1 Tax=Astrobacterium formosum TaxID=3069710 RepID=UPI0027B60F07|nr:ATP-dependent DNA ligase [Xanthobacteraceae bacterium Astr-EGSB]